MLYALYKLFDEKWWIYGFYDNPISLARAANILGLDGFETKVELVEESKCPS